MKIRRFTPRRLPQPKPKSQLPEGAFRIEFFCESESGFPTGQWFAALLYCDKVEFYRLPLFGYQTVSRLVNRFSEAEPVGGEVVKKLVTGSEVKIMSITPTSPANSSD